MLVFADYETEFRSRSNSTSGFGETDFVMLQASPIGHWQPVSISIQGNSESLSESSRCSSLLPSPGRFLLIMVHLNQKRTDKQTLKFHPNIWF